MFVKHRGNHSLSADSIAGSILFPPQRRNHHPDPRKDKPCASYLTPGLLLTSSRKANLYAPPCHQNSVLTLQKYTLMQKSNAPGPRVPLRLILDAREGRRRLHSPFLTPMTPSRLSSGLSSGGGYPSQDPSSLRRRHCWQKRRWTGMRRMGVGSRHSRAQR